MTVFEKIEALQAGIEGSPGWMVGQQLKDICAGDDHCAELVLHDLEDKSMDLNAAAKKIKEWADKQKRVGNCVCVPPNVAEKIIREFYGLPERMPADRRSEPPKEEAKNPDILDLSAFF